jgi:prephenate dehydrogenase
MGNKVGIIGIGLIGGSIAKGLRSSGWATDIWGLDANPSHAAKALELGLVDQMATFEEATLAMDVLVCAVPVENLVGILPGIMNGLKPGQIVIEVGSTKTPVYEALKNHPKRAQFVSTHPMAGTEFFRTRGSSRGFVYGKKRGNL